MEFLVNSTSYLNKYLKSSYISDHVLNQIELRLIDTMINPRIKVKISVINEVISYLFYDSKADLFEINSASNRLLETIYSMFKTRKIKLEQIMKRLADLSIIFEDALYGIDAKPRLLSKDFTSVKDVISSSLLSHKFSSVCPDIKNLVLESVSLAKVSELKAEAEPAPKIDLNKGFDRYKHILTKKKALLKQDYDSLLLSVPTMNMGEIDIESMTEINRNNTIVNRRQSGGMNSSAVVEKENDTVQNNLSKLANFNPEDIFKDTIEIRDDAVITLAEPNINQPKIKANERKSENSMLEDLFNILGAPTNHNPPVIFKVDQPNFISNNSNQLGNAQNKEKSSAFKIRPEEINFVSSGLINEKQSLKSNMKTEDLSFLPASYSNQAPKNGSMSKANNPPPSKFDNQPIKMQMPNQDNFINMPLSESIIVQAKEPFGSSSFDNIMGVGTSLNNRHSAVTNPSLASSPFNNYQINQNASSIYGLQVPSSYSNFSNSTTEEDLFNVSSLPKLFRGSISETSIMINDKGKYENSKLRGQVQLELNNFSIGLKTLCMKLINPFWEDSICFQKRIKEFITKEPDYSYGDGKLKGLTTYKISCKGLKENTPLINYNVDMRLHDPVVNFNCIGRYQSGKFKLELQVFNTDKRNAIQKADMLVKVLLKSEIGSDIKILKSTHENYQIENAIVNFKIPNFNLQEKFLIGVLFETQIENYVDIVKVSYRFMNHLPSKTNIEMSYDQGGSTYQIECVKKSQCEISFVL